MKQVGSFAATIAMAGQLAACSGTARNSTALTPSMQLGGMEQSPNPSQHPAMPRESDGVRVGVTFAPTTDGFKNFFGSVHNAIRPTQPHQTFDMPNWGLTKTQSQNTWQATTEQNLADTIR